MKRLFSGIQPSGNLHLGNYLGAIKQWVDMQEGHEAIFCIVDLHAITVPQDPTELRRKTLEIAKIYLASGINPEKSTLFIQSHVSAHTELGWILNCFYSYGQLTRMTQFKDKSAQVNDIAKESFISVGLLDYPVLQTADILIYKADYVPVGKDQEQHLELARDIAQRFNSQVGKEYFILPEPLYTETPKIRSTADPAKKMSKSAGEKHYINAFADEATIRRQIKSAVTDSGNTTAGTMAEGVQNLFELIKAAGWKTEYDQLMETFTAGSLKYVDLKQITADALVQMIGGFVEKKKEISADKRKLKDQVKQSSSEIRKRAQETLKEVKELVGLMNV